LEKSPLTEVGFENALLSNAPVFAKLRESGKTVAGKGPVYKVTDFTYGLIVPGEGQMGSVGMRWQASPIASLPAALPPAIRALPDCRDWVNVQTLGAKGDGATDDTASLQRAIAAHRVLYFPSGHYVVRDTLTLKAATVLIGLPPTLTQIDLLDETPGFQGVGAPKAVIFAPPGGK